MNLERLKVPVLVALGAIGTAGALAWQFGRDLVTRTELVEATTLNRQLISGQVSDAVAGLESSMKEAAPRRPAKGARRGSGGSQVGDQDGPSVRTVALASALCVACSWAVVLLTDIGRHSEPLAFEPPLSVTEPIDRIAEDVDALRAKIAKSDKTLDEVDRQTAALSVDAVVMACDADCPSPEFAPAAPPGLDP